LRVGPRNPLRHGRRRASASARASLSLESHNGGSDGQSGPASAAPAGRTTCCFWCSPHGDKTLEPPARSPPTRASSRSPVAGRGNRYFGPETLLKATLLSDNVVYAKLTLDLGPSSVAQVAHLMGITSPLKAYPDRTRDQLRHPARPSRPRTRHSPRAASTTSRARSARSRFPTAASSDRSGDRTTPTASSRRASRGR
jgi:hypothetical protein